MPHPDRISRAALPEHLLSVKEAAALSGWTPRRLREMARKGLVPGYKVGNGPRARLLFKWSEVEAALLPAAVPIAPAKAGRS
jgi:hypothetical protein